MLQLYGSPKSRALRCLWMLEEMGEPYQLIEKSTRPDELQAASTLASFPCENSHSRGWGLCLTEVHGHQPLPPPKNIWDRCIALTSRC